MPQLLFTIVEYIAEHRKKDSIWIVFNTRYNQIHALKQYPKEDESDAFRLYDKKFTDDNARQEFLEYMKANFSHIALIEVFDLVGTEWLQWPYLGSIAIDADIGSEVYNALCEKYGDAYEDPKAVNQVLWVMEYKDAKAIHEKRCQVIDDEFSED